MAHIQQAEFCQLVKRRFPNYFSNRLVLDIGALDINGNNQFLFDNCLYIGVDLAPGKNVDFVSKGHELALPDESFDVVISTECFEHDQYYDHTLRNIVRLLKPGGLFFFSCATTGRPEHGTRRTTPHDAPFIQNCNEWSDYYKNLEEQDIRDVFNLDTIFTQYEFTTNDESKDLYFWGIKAGQLLSRDNYSFQVVRPALQAQVSLLKESIDDREHQLAAANEHINALQADISELRANIGDIHHSFSWKLTIPVRVAGRLLRGEFGIVWQSLCARFNQLLNKTRSTGSSKD